jgi:hypothetical protein
MLNADADGAHRSGMEFREVVTGNGYVDHQVIAAIHAQAKNKAKFSAGLRWGNKENIWFWPHRLLALHLGHNCSNPSPRLSA